MDRLKEENYNWQWSLAPLHQHPETQNHLFYRMCILSEDVAQAYIYTSIHHAIGLLWASPATPQLPPTLKPFVLLTILWKNMGCKECEVFSKWKPLNHCNGKHFSCLFLMDKSTQKTGTKRTRAGCGVVFYPHVKRLWNLGGNFPHPAKVFLKKLIPFLLLQCTVTHVHTGTRVHVHIVCSLKC